MREGEYIHFGKFDKNNSQHLAVLSLCYDLGWVVYSKALNLNVADLDKLGSFISSKKSPVKKPLLEMTARECSKLITALEGILKSEYLK